MAYQEDWLKASFRGAEFLISTGTTAGGRKTVTHEFPNSDRRNVEDIGLLQKTFALEGILKEGKPGEPSLIQRRQTLILALETQGPGQLSHPFMGIFQVNLTSYTIDHLPTEAGTERVRMNFSVSQESILPTVQQGSPSTINESINFVLDGLKSIISETYAVVFADNFQPAIDKLQGVVNELKSISSEFVSDDEFFDVFFDSLNTFETDIVQLIQVPTNLGNDIIVLLENLENAIEADEQIKETFEKLYGFGDDDEVLIGTTQELLERERNRKSINEAIQIASLAVNYRTITNIDFLTVDEIEAEKKRLEDQYITISKTDTFKDNDFGLKEARVEVRQFFESELITAFNITEFETKTIPMTILTYQHYGNLDFLQNLIDLNNVRDVSFFAGSAKILTR